MAEPNFYHTIQRESISEFMDRGSRFLAMVYPLNKIEFFKEILNSVKKQHPKASHHCFAYRVGVEGSNFRASDDGEPGGTAGKPILGQIDSRGLTNVLVIVVRYFGGTLLGVPGLIHAYKTAASQALDLAGILRMEVEKEYRLEFAYPSMGEVMRILKQEDGRIINQEMQLFCRMIVSVPLKKKESFQKKLEDLPDVAWSLH